MSITKLQISCMMNIGVRASSQPTWRTSSSSSPPNPTMLRCFSFWTRGSKRCGATLMTMIMPSCQHTLTIPFQFVSTAMQCLLLCLLMLVHSEQQFNHPHRMPMKLIWVITIHQRTIWDAIRFSTSIPVKSFHLFQVYASNARFQTMMAHQLITLIRHSLLP